MYDTEHEPCDDCALNNRCPRCGATGAFFDDGEPDEGLACQLCGWDYDDELPPDWPYDGPCPCELEWMDKGLADCRAIPDRDWLESYRVDLRSGK